MMDSSSDIPGLDQSSIVSRYAGIANERYAKESQGPGHEMFLTYFSWCAKIIKFINNGPGTFLPSGACSGSRRSSAMTQSIGFGFPRAVLLADREAGLWAES